MVWLWINILLSVSDLCLLIHWSEGKAAAKTFMLRLIIEDLLCNISALNKKQLDRFAASWVV